MGNLKIAVIVGSNSRESINRRFAEALVRLLPSGTETSIVRIDDLPLYNRDLEGHRPIEVNRFTDEIVATDALLVVTPEHNRSVPAVLKNAIDWGSKPTERCVWRGKVAAITGTSPGAIGTAVGQQHLRQILGVLGSLVVGGEAYVVFRPNMINDDGDIADEGTRSFLRTYLETFVSVGKAMRP